MRIEVAETQKVNNLHLRSDIFFSFFFFFSNKGRLSSVAPHLGVSGVLEAWLAYLLLQMHLQSLFGGSTRGMHLLLYPWLKNPPPLWRKIVLFDGVRSFGRDTLGEVREKGETHLANRISWIDPCDQWGDRCLSHVALKCPHLTGDISAKKWRVWETSPGGHLRKQHV